MQNFHDYSAGPNQEILVERYEEMVNNDSVGFFDHEAFEQLLDYYESRVDLEKALEVVDHALSQHHFTSIFYIRKAQILLDLDLILDAENLLKQAEIFDASELELHLTKAEIALRLQQHTKSLNILDHALTLANRDDYDDIFLLRANVFEDLEQFDKVFECLGHAIRCNPNNAETLNRIWLSVELSEKYEESIQLHLEVIDLEPYSYMAWYNLGQAYFKVGLHEKSLEAYDYCIVINEKFEYAYREMANVYFELKNFAKAIEWYKEGLLLFNQDVDLYLRLGLCYEEIEDYTQAKESYMQGIQIDPHHAQTYYHLGDCFAQENRWQSALKAFAKAVKYNNTNIDYQLALAEAYAEVENFDLAEEWYRKAIESSPENFNTWVHFTGFLFDIGLKEEGLTIAIEGGKFCYNIELVYCQIAAYLLTGRRQQGLMMLAEALATNYKAHYILFEVQEKLQEDPDVLAYLATYKS